MHAASNVLGSFESALDKCLADDHLGRDIRQFTPLPTSTCFRIGSKFRCIRSTPTEMQSMSENDFECLARTGVKSLLNAKLSHVAAKRAMVERGRSPAKAHIVRDLGESRRIRTEKRPCGHSFPHGRQPGHWPLTVIAPYLPTVFTSRLLHRYQQAIER